MKGNNAMNELQQQLIDFLEPYKDKDYYARITGTGNGGSRIALFDGIELITQTESATATEDVCDLFEENGFDCGWLKPIGDISLAKRISKLKPGEKLDFKESGDGSWSHCAEIISTSFDAQVLLIGYYGGDEEIAMLNVTGMNEQEIEGRTPELLRGYFDDNGMKWVYVEDTEV
jgi:hypothetical protein